MEMDGTHRSYRANELLALSLALAHLLFDQPAAELGRVARVKDAWPFLKFGAGALLATLPCPKTAGYILDLRPILMKGNQYSFPCDVSTLSCSKTAGCILDFKGKSWFLYVE